MLKRQCNSYSIGQKTVVTYAIQYGRNEAARHFELDKTMVRRWVKSSETWTDKTNNKSMWVGPGRKAFYPKAKNELYNWVLDQRKKGLAVTFITLRISILEILDQPEIIVLYGNLRIEFKATTGWLNAFIKRYKLSRI